jgi:hypothetical protein
MSAAELRLRYIPDDQWIGELEATVVSGAFSGKARAWFDRKDLQENFLGGLLKFPLDQSDPPTIDGGFGANPHTGAPPQSHLRVVIGPYNARGILLVQVDLVTPYSTPGDQAVTARFFTEYSLLDKFASELAATLDGTREAALLTGRDRP